jgi:hypothetical protein
MGASLKPTLAVGFYKSSAPAGGYEFFFFRFPMTLGGLLESFVVVHYYFYGQKEVVPPHLII